MAALLIPILLVLFIVGSELTPEEKAKEMEIPSIVATFTPKELKEYHKLKRESENSIDGHMKAQEAKEEMNAMLDCARARCNKPL